MHDLGQRLFGFLGGVATAAALGYKDLDCWALAHEVMGLKLRGRSSTYRLRDLVSLVLTRPPSFGAASCQGTQASLQAIECLIGELGNLRELTRRRRYRAWGCVARPGASSSKSRLDLG